MRDFLENAMKWLRSLFLFGIIIQTVGVAPFELHTTAAPSVVPGAFYFTIVTGVGFMTRRESREQAFILIFEQIFHPDSSVGEILEAAGISDDVQYPDAFAVSLAEKAAKEREKTDDVIQRFAKGWKLNRLSRVCLAVLRLAICEILFFDDIPRGVSINEAVELAKKYATPEDAAYINGVLGAFLRSLNA